MSKPISGYDIIGDIHGHSEELKTILLKMGYGLKNHVWMHPERKVIFVGDYIDRGPAIRETLYIVKAMVDAGAALAIMGNHEYNAMAFSYHHPDGGHIRKHSLKNIIQHYQTMKQFQGYESEWDDYLAWFANLPLFLETDGVRVVHACWDDNAIAYLKNLKGGITKEILLKAHDKIDEAYKVFEETLKGKEIKLPDGHFFIDKDSNKRTKCRTKWWLNPDGLTLGEYLFHSPVTVLDMKVSAEHQSAGYDVNAPTIFFGHYWLSASNPEKQASNVCCLDYSVAKKGSLVAYRYFFENSPTDSGFVTVESFS